MKDPDFNNLTKEEQRAAKDAKIALEDMLPSKDAICETCGCNHAEKPCNCVDDDTSWD